MPVSGNRERSSQAAQVARSAGIVSIAILSSRLTGLLREIVMAQKFGAGFAYDAFLLGFRIPNLTRNLFAEGGLSSAFVPTFTNYLEKEDRGEAARLSNLVGTALITIVGGVILLGIVFSPQLAYLLAPGFGKVPGKFELSVHLTRVMFPFLLLVALAAQAMGILNACNRFAVPATASTFFNLSSVFLGLLLGFPLGPYLGISPIEGMAYGVVLGGLVQLLWNIPSLLRLGFGFRFDFHWRHPGLQQIFRLMIPAIVGNAAVQLNVMVNTNLASSISDPVRGPDGPVSWLAYAFRFMQLPLGLFGVSFASAILPSVSRSAASGNYEEFRKTVSRSTAIVLLMTIPSSVGLILLGRPIIGAIYQGGRFQTYDTQQTALALSCYCVGLAGYSATKILNPAFYALSDAKTPMWVSLLSVVMNFCLAELLISKFHMGISALALSTSVVALAGCAFLFVVLRRRLGGLETRYLGSRFVRICLACIAMGAPVWAVSTYISRHLGDSKRADFVNLAISIPVGIAFFGGAAALLKIEETRSMANAVAARARKLFIQTHARIHNK
jgi:putative peptidoglycan lipid II flippase